MRRLQQLETAVSQLAHASMSLMLLLSRRANFAAGASCPCVPHSLPQIHLPFGLQSRVKLTAGATRADRTAPGRLLAAGSCAGHYHGSQDAGCHPLPGAGVCS